MQIIKMCVVFTLAFALSSWDSGTIMWLYIYGTLNHVLPDKAPLTAKSTVVELASGHAMGPPVPVPVRPVDFLQESD